MAEKSYDEIIRMIINACNDYFYRCAEDDMKTVIECGADLLQGYYFGRPSFEPEPYNQKIAQEIIDINNSLSNHII